MGKIEQFDISDLSYANAILSSNVSLVFEDSNLDLEELLTEAKVIELRNQAIINCNKEKNNLTECEASKKHPCLFHIIDDPCKIIYYSVSSLSRTKI